MITVALRRSHGGFVGFSANGHALAGTYGEDVVCAAVSALLQSALLGLTDYARLHVDSSTENGAMYVAIVEPVGDAALQVETIFETMRLGLESIQLAHPQNLRLLEQEVV